MLPPPQFDRQNDAQLLYELICFKTSRPLILCGILCNYHCRCTWSHSEQVSCTRQNKDHTVLGEISKSKCEERSDASDIINNTRPLFQYCDIFSTTAIMCYWKYYNWDSDKWCITAIALLDLLVLGPSENSGGKENP